MKNPKQTMSKSRRKFLRDAGISGGVAAVVAGTPATVLAETDEDTGQRPREGYRLSKHILDYYKSAAN